MSLNLLDLVRIVYKELDMNYLKEIIDSQDTDSIKRFFDKKKSLVSDFLLQDKKLNFTINCGFAELYDKGVNFTTGGFFTRFDGFDTDIDYHKEWVEFKKLKDDKIIQKCRINYDDLFEDEIVLTLKYGRDINIFLE